MKQYTFLTELLNDPAAQSKALFDMYLKQGMNPIEARAKVFDALSGYENAADFGKLEKKAPVGNAFKKIKSEIAKGVAARNTEAIAKAGAGAEGLNQHVGQSVRGAMENLGQLDKKIQSLFRYKPTDNPMNAFKAAKKVESILTLAQENGTYLSNDIKDRVLFVLDDCEKVLNRLEKRQNIPGAKEAALKLRNAISSAGSVANKIFSNFEKALEPSAAKALVRGAVGGGTHVNPLRHIWDRIGNSGLVKRIFK